MPKATTSALCESGRAISGRIGISFASTVSSVIDVPATHNSGVDDFWPAWTDAISSSSDAKIRPPSDSMRVTFGCVTAPGLAARNTMTAMRPIPTVDSQRDRGDASQASTTPSVAFMTASTITIAGEPIVGIRTNGMTRLPRIAPVVFDARSAPDSEPASPSSSRRSADAVGNAMPRIVETGRTTTTAATISARTEANGSPGSSWRGDSITSSRPRTARTATASCATASTRIGLVMRGRRRVNSTAPSAIPARKSANTAVKTYV